MQQAQTILQQNFQGNYYNYSGKTKAQKIAIASSSIPVSGLGQIINGETSKGIAFFLATLLNLACFKARGKRNKLAHIIVALALKAWSSVDAYKRA